jgi:hypothetical protein
MELISTKEAADLLGVNIKTVHALMADGMPHLRFSKRIIRIDRDASCDGSVGGLLLAGHFPSRS